MITIAEMNQNIKNDNSLYKLIKIKSEAGK